jgi:hypothetical protein
MAARPGALWYNLQLSLAQEILACKEKYLFIDVLIFAAQNTSWVIGGKSAKKAE